MNRPSKPKNTDLTEKTNQSTASQTGMADAGNMDKIRDILFGNMAKDYEKRFIQFENQLSQETAELRSEIFKRIDALEVYLKQEIKDINARLKSEANERAREDKAIQKETASGFDALNKRLTADEEKLAQKSTELREQILDQSKKLSGEITSKFDQASVNLKRSVSDLNESKVNRSDLSGFFLEIAMRLSGETAPE